MIRSWLRKTLPSEGYFIGGLTLILGLELLPTIYLYLRTRHGLYPLISITNTAELYLLAAAYGLHRVVSYHPGFQVAYHNWLDDSPWSAKLPLPLGPVYLIWQDVLIVGLLTGAACCLEKGVPLLVFGLFCIAYLVALSRALISTNAPAAGYGIAFGLGGLIVLWDYPILQLILLAAIYGVGLIGLRRSLEEFPHWDPELLQQNVSMLQKSLNQSFRISNSSDLDDVSRLSWPFDQLKPQLIQREQSRIPAEASFLCSWFLFALLSRVSHENEGVFAGIGSLLGLLAIGLAILRTSNYLNGYSAPLDISGRLFTGRFIIPGFDIVFVAPLCILLTGAVATRVLFYDNWPPQFVIPIGLLLVLLEYQYIPPTLNEWKLTGNHRIVPFSDRQSQFVQTQ